MSNNRSKGTHQVFSNDPIEINLVLQAISDRLDKLEGLRGRSQVYDRIGVGEPVASGDAARLSDVPGVTAFVVMGTTSAKNDLTATRVLRFVDADGILIHAIGTIE